MRAILALSLLSSLTGCSPGCISDFGPHIEEEANAGGNYPWARRYSKRPADMASGGGGIALVQSAVSNDNSGFYSTGNRTATFGAAVTANNKVILAFAGDGCTVSSVTDNAGGGTNTYTNGITTGNLGAQQIYAGQQTNGGATIITVTVSTYCVESGVAYEVSGLNASDTADVTNSGVAFNSPDIDTGAMASTSNSFTVAVCRYTDTAAATVAAGWSTGTNQTFDFGLPSNYISSIYRVGTASTTYNGQWTEGGVGTQYWAAAGAQYK